MNKPSSLSVLTLALVSLLGSCADTANPQASQEVPTASSTSTSVTLEPSVGWYGKEYSLKYSECVQKLWDNRVNIWNSLSEADRKQLGWKSYEDLFIAKGWPISHPLTLESPVVQKECNKNG